MPRFLLLVAFCLLLAPGLADARRPATKAEVKGIQAGVRTYAATSGCCAPGTTLRFLSAAVSTHNKDFGVAKVAARTQDGGLGPRATVVLVHTRSGRWTAIAFGTNRLACGLNPKIRRDLGLTACY